MSQRKLLTRVALLSEYSRFHSQLPGTLKRTFKIFAKPQAAEKQSCGLMLFGTWRN